MNRFKDISFDELYNLFKSNDASVLNDFYNSQRSYFFSWALKRFDLDEDNIADIYQDAVIVLYKNIVQGKTGHVKGTVVEYLFGIAKKLTLKKSIKLKKTFLTENVNSNDEGVLESESWDKFEKHELKEKLKEALSSVGENCKEIISLYYLQRYNLEEISEIMNYDNAGVVKSRKYQCMKKIKSLLKRNA